MFQRTVALFSKKGKPTQPPLNAASSAQAEVVELKVRLATLEAKMIQAIVGGAAPYSKVIATLEKTERSIFEQSVEFRYSVASLETFTLRFGELIEDVLKLGGDGAEIDRQAVADGAKTALRRLARQSSNRVSSDRGK